jgi:hypothetical protein
LFCDDFQRVREVVLHEPVAALKNLAILHENRRGRWPAHNQLLVLRKRQREIVFDRNAVAGELDRRRNQIGERKFPRAELFQRGGKPRDRAGHADTHARELRFRGVGLAVFVEKAFRAERLRRDLPEVKRDCLLLLGKPDHEETAAAEIARARQAHRERKTDRDRGIDRVPAFLQNLDSDPGRKRFLR